MPNKLREVRLAMEVSQTELARRMNTSRGQVKKLENGERKLSLEWIERAAKALGVRPSSIIDEHAEPLTEIERQIIDLYANLPDDKKETALTIIRALVSDEVD